VFHLQGNLVDRERLSACADLLMTTSPSVLVYSAMDGWRRQMVQRGREMLSAALDLAANLRNDLDRIADLHVLDDELLGVQASHDLDRLQILMDVSASGASGYAAADWLRQQRRIDVGMSDHRRILATLSVGDDKNSAERLVDALWAWRKAVHDNDMPPAAPIRLPAPSEIQLETVMSPREAFFAPTAHVPASEAVGRVAAEQITPYPPGIPAVVPGERLTDVVVDYLRSGHQAGMNLPDPADPSMQTFRVVA
jgi:lysine decarboxylase